MPVSPSQSSPCACTVPSSEIPLHLLPAAVEPTVGQIRFRRGTKDQGPRSPRLILPKKSTKTAVSHPQPPSPLLPFPMPNQFLDMFPNETLNVGVSTIRNTVIRSGKEGRKYTVADSIAQQ